MKTDLSALIALTYNECDENGETALLHVVQHLNEMLASDAGPHDGAVKTALFIASNPHQQCTMQILAGVRAVLKLI